MIYIYNNGLKWSSNALYFIDDEGFSKEEMEKFVEIIKIKNDEENGKIVGCAYITWWEGGSIALHNWFGPWCFISPFSDRDEIDISNINDFSLSSLLRLLNLWEGEKELKEWKNILIKIRKDIIENHKENVQ